MVSNVGFIVIGQDPKTAKFWIHERENNNGNPGKINKFIDGAGDVRPSINDYVKQGCNPENIIYNGQPVTDVFTKTTDNQGNVIFKGNNKKGKVTNVGGGEIRQIVITPSGQKVIIPTMMGSETNVEALDDGTYKVTTQTVVYPKPDPKVTIMSEEELVDHFAKYSQDKTASLDLKA